MMRWCVVLCVMSCAASELTRVKRLAKYAGKLVESSVVEDLMKQVVTGTYSSLQGNKQPLLFKEYPLLADSISYISLGDLPTPITQCGTFGDTVGCAGSNHVLTTSAYAKTLGLKTIGIM